MSRRVVNGVLLDVRQAAAYLGGNERWLRRLLERGVVPYRRIGRNVFFKRSEISPSMRHGLNSRRGRRPIRNRTVFARIRKAFDGLRNPSAARR